MSLTKVSFSMINGIAKNVVDYGAVGDGVTNDTVAIQAAITDTAAGGALYFPPGVYLIDSLDTGLIESVWYLDLATLKANSNVAQTHLLKFQGRHCNIYNLRINMNFKTNYDAALWWYNATNASQFNNFYGMEIRYAIRGVVYGQFPGVSSTLLAQSENTLFGYVSYGVEQPFLSNHGNGVIDLEGCTLSAQDQDWTTGFDDTANRAFQALAGVVNMNGGEVQNTIADVTSYAADVDGGTVYMNNVITEVNVPFSISGQLFIDGGRVQNTQSLTNQFYIPPTADSTTKFSVSNCLIYRQPTVGSFSDKALINNVGANQNIDIVFSNCNIREWASFVQIANGTQQNIKFVNCEYYPDGTQDAYYNVFKLDVNGQNLLDIPDIDVKGYTTNGFYLKQITGASSTMTLNADVPTAYYANSIQLLSNTVGSVSSVDGTSLTTVKATSYPVTDFDKFYIEGWFKGVDTGSGIQCSVGLCTYDSSGAYVDFYLAFDENNGGITSAFKYLRGVVKVPSGSIAAYAGFGVKSTSCNIRFSGLKVHRGDWNVN